MFTRYSLRTAIILASVTIAQADTIDATIDSFVESVTANKDLSDEQRAKALDTVKQSRADEYWRDAAITDGLREVYPEFKAALTALGEEQLNDAVPQLRSLAESKDPFLAADATFFLARAHMIQQHYEEALARLDGLSEKHTHQAEAMFLRGMCQSKTLLRDEAEKTLSQFIEQFPHAPERMQFAAWRQVELLKTLKAGTIHDVQERMEYSRHRLAQEKSGNNTQGEQKRIVDMLAKLIKEAEERECACNGGGSGGGAGQGGQGQGQGSGQGGPNGQGTGGAGPDSPAQDTARREHRGGAKSPWGHLRDKERDPVYNAIKAKYPDRYTQLIEQYYKSLQDEEE